MLHENKSKKLLSLPDSHSLWEVFFNIVCHKDGKYVRVDIICFGTCVNDTYDIGSQIDKMMKW